MADANNLTLGERIEVVMNTRADGVYGNYVGEADGIFAAVNIDNIDYHIERDVEANAPWFYRVENIQTGAHVTFTDRHDLGTLTSL